jgi:hypothetical protein
METSGFMFLQSNLLAFLDFRHGVLSLATPDLKRDPGRLDGRGRLRARKYRAHPAATRKGAYQGELSSGELDDPFISQESRVIQCFLDVFSP